MRIALLAPLVSAIAAPFLGGTQALLADLATGLARRGHAVTLYAADGSAVAGVRLQPLGVDAATLRPARFMGAADGAVAGETDATIADEDMFRASYAFMHAFRVMAAHAGEYDLVHAHAFDWPAYAFASIQPAPVVHTLHLPAVDPAIRRMLATLAPAGRETPTRLVTVSQACAATYTGCRIDKVIYNGIAVDQMPFGAAALERAPVENAPEGPYLLFAGRMTPEKGVEDALEIAARAGRFLLLAGGIYDEGYFRERAQPRLEAAPAAARYLGALGREELWRLMAGAEAVLCPIHWDEPFGLVAAEAQATGSPVVGYGRGGLLEVVRDGVTGRLVPEGDVAAAVAAIHEVSAMGERQRAERRRHVAERFGMETMLDAYEAFYTEMLA